MCVYIYASNFSTLNNACFILPRICKPHKLNDPLALLILNRTTGRYTPDSTVYRICSIMLACRPCKVVCHRHSIQQLALVRMHGTSLSCQLTACNDLELCSRIATPTENVPNAPEIRMPPSIIVPIVSAFRGSTVCSDLNYPPPHPQLLAYCPRSIVVCSPI